MCVFVGLKFVRVTMGKTKPPHVQANQARTHTSLQAHQTTDCHLAHTYVHSHAHPKFPNRQKDPHSKQSFHTRTQVSRLDPRPRLFRRARSSAVSRRLLLLHPGLLRSLLDTCVRMCVCACCWCWCRVSCCTYVLLVWFESVHATRSPARARASPRPLFPTPTHFHPHDTYP